MAFGAKIARAAEDEQTAYALAQQAQEPGEDNAPVSRPAAPTAAPTPSAQPRFARPAFNPTEAPAAVPPAVPTAAATPVPPAVTAPAQRRFVRPSAMVQPSAPVAPATVAPATVAPVVSAAVPSPAVPVPATSVSPAPEADGRQRFAFGRPGAPAAATPASAPAAPAAAIATPAVTATERPRFAFGRPAASTSPAAAATATAPPRAGGFRPGGFRASGMGEAPPRPTGEEHDDASSSAPATSPVKTTETSVTQAFSRERQEPARRPPMERPATSGANPSAAPSAPRAGGFRGTGVGAAPARPTGEEGEMPSRGRGAPRQDSNAARLAASGLPVRLDRLIDVVCDHMGKTADDVAQIKKRALQEPDEVTEAFDKIFREEIEPQIKQNAQRFETLKEAMATHPGKVVFMHIKDGKQHLVGLDRSKAGAAVMYEGQMIETVDAVRTMFAPPSVLFAAPAEPDVVATDEAAFDEPSESSVPAARGPRP